MGNQRRADRCRESRRPSRRSRSLQAGDANRRSPLADASTPAAYRAARPKSTRDTSDRALRVTVDNLNRLLGLAGETLVESRWIKPFGESLLRLKRLQYRIRQSARRAARCAGEADPGRARRERDERRAAPDVGVSNGFWRSVWARSTQPTASPPAWPIGSTIRRLHAGCALSATERCGFPRMVRDVGRSLGKQVRLEIAGASTQVDRDILAKLEAPLGHLLRNAVDHGIETPAERVAAGKPAEGVVSLEAHHHAGALQIVVSDDGRGIDLDRLRKAIVKRRLASAETADKLSECELLEFLFLPGFSMKDTVTEISGRGVGLDVVQDMVKEVRGVVRISSEPGKRHPLPPAAAADAVGDPHSSGRNRRGALRLSARPDRAGDQAREGKDRDSRGAAAFQLRGSADRHRHSASGAASRRAQRRRQRIGGRRRRRAAEQHTGWSWTGSSADASWSCSRSTRVSARSRTSAPPR